MSDLSERMLKGWRPRQASAGLRSRIFACDGAPGAMALKRADFDWAGLTRWLVPAFGCFLMVTATLTDPEMRIPDDAMTPLSEQRHPVSIAWHNNVPSTTVEWTFARASFSNSGHFVRTETNSLIK